MTTDLQSRLGRHGAALTAHDDVPTLSDTVRQILTKLSPVGEVDLRPVADLIRRDAVISARVLRVTNSAAVGAHVMCTQVDRAVTVLGARRLKSIVLSIGIFTAFEQTASRFPMWRYWLAAATEAYLARAIAEQLPGCDLDLAFTCGLTRSLGRLVIAHSLPELSRQIIDRARRHHESYCAAAQGCGIEEAAVTAWILQRWEMHPVVIEAALNQRQDLATASVMVRLCHLTFEACRTGSSTSIPGDYDEEPVSSLRDAIALLGLPDDLVASIHDLRNREREVARHLIENAR